MSIYPYQPAAHSGGFINPVTASLPSATVSIKITAPRWFKFRHFYVTHFCTPCRLSTLLITLISRPWGPRARRTSLTSWAERMKLANTMSMPWATPNLRSASSRSLTACRPIRSQPGRLTPFRLQSSPPASTTVSTQSGPAEEEEEGRKMNHENV